MLKILLFLINLAFISTVYANTLQQMKTELNAEQYARAATTGLALLREQPHHLETQFLTALAFQKNKQIKQAIRYYQEIINQHPELPEPRNNLAIIYLQLGDYDNAVKLLIESINTHPAYAAAYKNLNSIYQGLASEAYRKALSDEADSNTVLNHIQLTELDELYQPATQVNSTPPLVVAQARIENEPQAAAVVTPVEPAVQTVPETPAAAPVSEASTPSPAPQMDNQTLIDLVTNWADAWSEQKFEQYAATYSDEYKGRYSNHQEWLKQRYRRIVRRDRIKVSLSNIEIKSLTATQAVIDFQQAYQSPSYSDKVVKRLRLKRINQQWKIYSEVTLAVL